MRDLWLGVVPARGQESAHEIWNESLRNLNNFAHHNGAVEPNARKQSARVSEEVHGWIDASRTRHTVLARLLPSMTRYEHAPLNKGS